MRDRRSERPRGSALGIRVNPLRIVGRGRERVDALLGHLSPRGRPELVAGELREHAHPAAVPQRKAVAAHV